MVLFEGFRHEQRNGRQHTLSAVRASSQIRSLPAPTAVKATPCEASTREASTRVATVQPTADRPAPEVGRSATNGARPETRSAEVAGTAVIAAEPRASTDKDAAGEPAWPIVTIRRARVGVISIVAVGAHVRWTNVSWAADPHADHNSLCMRIRCANQTNAKCRQNS
jgi:hypothetical protein